MLLRKEASEAARQSWPVFAIVAAACAAQLLLVTRPLAFLLANVLPDDSFYYFQIAHNIALGLGSTFDGINATNGYHPLWMVVLVGIYKLFSHGAVGDMVPIYIALKLSVALNVLTALAVWRILTRFSANRWLVAAGVAVWSLNPFMLFESVNGLETSLSLLLFALFFLAALRLQEGRAPQGLLGAALLGVLGGLMVLARLDAGICYFAAWWVWLLVRDRKNNWLFALEAGAIALATAAPWFVWNWSHFHMLLTSASQATTLVNHTLIVQDNGSSVLQMIKAVVYSLYNGGELLLQRTGALPVALAFAGLGAAYLAGGRLAWPALRQWGAQHALLAGFVLLFLANVAVRWGGRPWYFMSLNIFVAIGVMLVLGELMRDVRRRRTLAAALVCIALFFFAVSWSKELRNQSPAQLDMYAMAAWMNANLPQGSVVGAFNAGVEGYFASVRVVNLDGLVNNAAYEALRTRTLYTYIRDAQLAYISDWPISLNYRYKSFLDTPDIFGALTVEHTEAGNTGGRFAGGLTLYHVK